MLTPNIAASYASGVAALDADADLVARGAAGDNPTTCRAALFSTDAATFRGSEVLQAEVFGASSLVVRCADAAEMASVAAGLEGQLTATLHADDSDHDAGRPRCCRRPRDSRSDASCSTAGRPASRSVTRWCTAGRSPPPRTRAPPRSGARAIERFLRPVAYQDVPKALLPSAIADGNPDGLWRRIDGQLTQD